MKIYILIPYNIMKSAYFIMQWIQVDTNTNGKAWKNKQVIPFVFPIQLMFWSLFLDSND